MTTDCVVVLSGLLCCYVRVLCYWLWCIV